MIVICATRCVDFVQAPLTSTAHRVFLGSLSFLTHSQQTTLPLLLDSANETAKQTKFTMAHSPTIADLAIHIVLRVIVSLTIHVSPANLDSTS